MNSIQTLIILLTSAIFLVGLAFKLRIAYPIALVLGGSFLGFFPGLTNINFDPNLILVIVLPPTLYYAAYSIPYKEFMYNLRDILWLGLGLVFVTTLVVGLCFKWLFPDLPWEVAFIFGAIISPPDAIAATTILRRFNIHTRLLTTLEGESLINDAAGLLLYKLGVIALLSGSFSWFDASVEFAKIAGGGVFIGLTTGLLLHRFSSRFFDPVLAVVFSFIIPYITYILADSFGVSGILAVVISGLIGSLLRKDFSSLTRVVGWASWDILIIFLNCFVFILIGLQLHGLVERLTFNKTLLYLSYGIFLTAVSIFVRFLWVYIRKNIKTLTQKIKRDSFDWDLKDVTILSWCGMRGIVSLAAALALPYEMPNGAPFPGRDIVIFLTFIIILLTLLIPGLSLSRILQWLKIRDMHHDHSTKMIRKELLTVANEEIQRLYNSRKIDDEEYSFLVTYFNSRHQVLEIASQTKQKTNNLEQARQEILQKKHQYLLDLWEKNEINDHLFNLLDHEIDLEEVYVPRAEI